MHLFLVRMIGYFFPQSFIGEYKLALDMISVLLLNNRAVVLQLGLQLLDKDNGLRIIVIEVKDYLFGVVVLPDELD